MSFFNELKRRNVFRVAAAYIVTAWLVVQVVETIFPAFGFGDAAIRIVVIVFGIGLISTLILAWAFELTPEGLKKDKDVDRSRSLTMQAGKKLDRIIMAVLALAVAYFLFDRLVLSPERETEIAEEARQAGAEQALEEARLGMWNEKSIAVLPFINRSELQEDEWFTDGMHDELLTRLSRIGSLKVISRTSVMEYRDTKKKIPEIAKELGVAHILEGGVQRAGDSVRINVQLINAHTDEHLWAEIYDRKMSAENLFAIQSEISTKIANALNAELSPQEESRVYDLPTSSLEAYNHYLRGRQLMATRRAKEMEQALKEFEMAVEADPEFALAWVGIADTHALLLGFSSIQVSETLEIREQAIDKALALDEQLGEAYTSLGMLYVAKGKPEQAEAAFRKAIVLSPNYAQAYHWYAGLLGGWEDAEKQLALYYKGAQLDPLSSVIQVNIADVLANLGRDEEAMDQYRDLLQMNPEFNITYIAIGRFHQERDRLAESIKWFREGIKREPRRIGGWYGLLISLVRLGDLEEIARMHEKMDQLGWAGQWHGTYADYIMNLAQGEWRDALEAIGKIESQLQTSGQFVDEKVDAYLVAGELQKVRQYLNEVEPNWVDPDRWHEYFDSNDGASSCEASAILLGTGDLDSGRDLLRQAIHYFEVTLPGLAKREPLWTELWICYLADGTHEKALDFFEKRIEHGFIGDWWLDKQMPWWEPVRDHPRFLALVKKIDEKMAGERELLRQMEASGTTAE